MDPYDLVHEIIRDEHMILQKHIENSWRDGGFNNSRFFFLEEAAGGVPVPQHRTHRTTEGNDTEVTTP